MGEPLSAEERLSDLAEDECVDLTSGMVCRSCALIAIRAAESDALERAASVAECEAARWDPPDDKDHGCEKLVAQQIAERIRALKGKVR
jgi:hypothetical protein